MGSGDVTTLALISEDSKATAKFLAKADGVLSGLRVADLVFDMVRPMPSAFASVSRVLPAS